MQFSAPASADPAEALTEPAAGVPVAGAPFAGVPDQLQGALERRGFAALTPVQAAVLAADDGARDLQISSQTGSGKTVALGFVLARGLGGTTGSERAGPGTLVITPTRELAMQVRDELAWLFADLGAVGLESVTGGTSVGRERSRLRLRPALVVGTPGRLLDHIRSGALDCSAVRQLVLDEADQMLDLGFRDELEAILATIPVERRTHLVSATFPPAVRELTRKYQRDALSVAGSAPGTVHADIEHIAHPIGGREHYAALVNLLLLAGDERTLVFVRTRVDTGELADKLSADGFAALPISGELAQAQRTRTLEAFRKGAVPTLIATDVAARGLDIPDVTRVVHVDPPLDGDVYTHRSGRTGRAGKKGQSVILVPRLQQARIRRILAAAGVRAQWLPAPGPAAVRARQQERFAERVGAALASAQPTAPQREVAERLLASSTPLDVVAGLLTALTGQEPREPFALESPPPMPSGRMPAPRHRSSDHEAGARSGYRQFRINWGTLRGAEPRRILAHICRRGDIESRVVGAIHLQLHSSTFEVADEVADAFAARVRTRDARDPYLEIVPAFERPEQRGPHGRRFPRPWLANRARPRHHEAS